MKKKSAKPDAAETALEKAEAFAGYTIEEIRYQRALMALRKEFSKEKVNQSLRKLRNPFASKEKEGDNSTLSKVAAVGTMAGKLMSHLPLIDAVLAGISIVGTGKKIFKIIGSLRKK